MMSKEEVDRVLKTQWIIIGLIFIILVINLMFIFMDAAFPIGKFTGQSLNITDCYFSGFQVYGVGDTQDEAFLDMTSRQDSYAHLYCNGKFAGDPDSLSIPGLGCLACKPDCEPTITDLTDVTFNETVYEVEASKQIVIKCT